MKAACQTVLVCLAGVAFHAALLGPVALGRSARGGNDFAAFYTGGRLAFSPDLYHLEAFRKVEANITGWVSDELVFIRLPWQAALFAPLAAFRFQTAHAIWFVLCVLSLILLPRCWPSIPGVACAGALAWTLPIAVAILGAQDIPLIALALSGGMLLIDRQEPIWAGLCLSVCAAKPHLFWPLALVFVFHRMWRVCAGGVLGLGALLAASYLTAGPRWVPGFAYSVNYIARSDSQTKLTHMPAIPAVLAGLPVGGAIEICIMACAIAAAFFIRNWKTAAAVALILGIVTAKHVFLADCSFALVSLFLVWNDARQRFGLMLALSPVVWLPSFFGHPVWTVGALLAGAGWLSLQEVMVGAPKGDGYYTCEVASAR
ncbi:MAG TPA: glycosyltransferase 87 family protein [Bryobacteraceae bacterium]|nr:glycosyltransferase 87 family protein [Bryobacteraceae bacterium]